MTPVDPQAIIESLQGTCQSADHVAYLFGCTEDLVLQIVVNTGEIEMCVLCNWWCEIDELEIIDDEYKCTECLDS